MSIDHMISEICNFKIEEVILIGDITILIDYKYQFMGNLHASRSHTQALSRYYLHRILECN